MQRLVLIFLQKVLPVFLFLGVCALIVFRIHTRFNLTLLQFDHPKSDFAQFTTQRLLKGQPVTASFTAKHNNLGIVEVRFYNFGRINKGKLHFQIKEKGDSNLIFEHAYTVDQFQPNTFFTFGFPPQAHSEGKIYEFTLESVDGTEQESVALSNVDPPLATLYKFNKEELKNNPTLFLYLLERNLPRVFSLPSYQLIEIGLLFLLLVVYTITIQKVNQTKIKYFTTHFIWPVIEDLTGLFKKLKKKPRTAQLIDKIPAIIPVYASRNFPEFDGLRAWAITSVILTHMTLASRSVLMLDENSKVLNYLFTAVTNFPFLGYYGGAMGVNLFFIISGFLIFMTLYKKKDISFFAFMKKRYQRLLPAHIVSLVPLIATTKAIGLFGIFTNAFFLAEFFPIVTTANILTWTMSYEVLFYSLCALWVIKARKNKKLLEWKYFFGAFALLFLTSTFITSFLKNYNIKYIDPNFFSSFFFGVLIARLYFELPKIWKKIELYGFPLAVGGLLLVLIYRFSWYHMVFLGIFGVIGIAAAYFVINLGLSFIVLSVLVKKDNFLKRFFRHKLLLVLGTISYSTYLTHLSYGIPLAAILVTGIPNLVLRFIMLPFLAVLISFIIGLFFFHYLEKPYFAKAEQSKEK